MLQDRALLRRRTLFRQTLRESEAVSHEGGDNSGEREGEHNGHHEIDFVSWTHFIQVHMMEINGQDCERY